MKTRILKISFIGLLAVSLFGSCKKDEPVTPVNTITNGGGSSSTSARHVTFTLDGITKTLESGVNSVTNSVEEMGSGTINNYVMINGGTFLDMTAYEKISIHLIKGFVGSPTSQEKEDMFVAGSYGYGKEYASPLIEGGFIWYIDANGTEWRTDNGSGNQGGSDFVIQSITATSGTDAYYGKKIMEVTFNCTLYDGNGNSKIITNGFAKTVIVSAN